jgi:hypothetical protein
MAEQQTCGQGLAENAVLPARLGKVTAALAEVLDAHIPALDLGDEAARKEHDAYARLVAQHRRLAAELESTASEMKGYEDLPMGRHDQDAMASPRVLESFRHFVATEKQLLAMLEERVRRDEEMLAQIEG